MPSLPLLVLVHGAFENASVWSATIAELQRLGRRAVAVPLPGRDGDARPKAEVSLVLYRDTVLAAIDAERSPVILVGHSFGGIVVSAVAEAAPEKIRNLVFLAAYLPASGDSLQTLAAKDRDSQMGPNFLVDPAALVATVKAEARADLFLNDGPPALRTGFAETMVPEPLPPLGTPVTLTPECFGSLAKTYIKTMRDVVVSPYLQDLMLAATPVSRVLEIDAGHAPFLTKPAELAALLAAVS